MMSLMERFHISPKEFREIDGDDKLILLSYLKGESMAKKQNGS